MLTSVVQDMGGASLELRSRWGGGTPSPRSFSSAAHGSEQGACGQGDT